MEMKFKELVNFVKAEHWKKKEEVLSFQMTSTGVSIYTTSNALKEKDQIIHYDYENSNIKEELKKIVDTDKDNYSTLVFVNKSNNYQFLINGFVLDLLLTAAYMEANNMQLNKKFKLKTKNKVREIIAPDPLIKGILQDINTILQHTYDKRNEDFQVAYKKGKSIKSNAEPHLNNKYIYKTDLHNFFPSCKRERVEKYVEFLFSNSVNPKYIKDRFLDIILYDDALFIGSPVSGTLANAIISKPVEYIKHMCDKFNMTFTVYADDMTFSSNKFITKDFVLSLFDRAFVMYGMDGEFELNKKKCYGASNSKRSVTGVVLNDSNKMTCNRAMYNEIRQTLHQLSYGDTSHYIHNKLSGKMAFMAMVDQTGKLKKLVAKYEPTIRKYKLMSDEKIKEMI